MDVKSIIRLMALSGEDSKNLNEFLNMSLLLESNYGNGSLKNFKSMIFKKGINQLESVNDNTRKIICKIFDLLLLDKPLDIITLILKTDFINSSKLSKKDIKYIKDFAECIFECKDKESLQHAYELLELDYDYMLFDIESI